MTMPTLPALNTALLAAPLRPQAVLSMLHEPAHLNSATRRFRGDAVLAWTLERLSRSRLLAGITVICWDDQLDDVGNLAEEHDANVLAKSSRQNLPSVNAIAAARRWHDGWRGGLRQTCWFDRGYHAPFVREVIDETDADAVVLIDPASALVDAQLIDQLITQARHEASQPLLFTPGVPGLGGALLRSSYVSELKDDHPGRQLAYRPEQPRRDPIGTSACVDVGHVVARTPGSLLLDSDRQIRRSEELFADLNGTLAHADALSLASRLPGLSSVGTMPREITLELTTQRRTLPVYLQRADRPDMTVETAVSLFSQLSQCEDLRLTLAGSGDPLLHPSFVEIVEQARYAGIRAICVETDLLPATPEFISHLAGSGVDVVAVHMPAVRPETYAQTMGVDRLQDVLENLGRLVSASRKGSSGTPLIVPIFTKTRSNSQELEAWYDHWLATLDGVSVRSPAAGCDACSVVDMTPPRRSACWRIERRLTVLSDGRYVTCEQDARGAQALGTVQADDLQTVWQQAMGDVRSDHARGSLATLPVCRECKQWHQP